MGAALEEKVTQAVRQHDPGRAPWVLHLEEATRGRRVVIRSGRDVKSWAEKFPTPEEVRPSSCQRCGAASRPLGGLLQLHGHGVRSRQVRGPATPTGPPELRVTSVRRYLCTRCRATQTVTPREVLAKRLFSAAAIALALAFFGVTEMALSEVRARISPWVAVGATAAAGWVSLRRWVVAVREGRLFAVRAAPTTWTARQVAARAAMTLAARAPVRPGTDDVVANAFVGALSG